jgi:hypothetical protein
MSFDKKEGREGVPVPASLDSLFEAFNLPSGKSFKVNQNILKSKYLFTTMASNGRNKATVLHKMYS